MKRVLSITLNESEVLSNISQQLLKTGEYLDEREIKNLNNTGYHILRNFVIYTGTLVFLAW
jgi:hypothetical protein